MTRKQEKRKELPLIICEYDSSEFRVKEATELLDDQSTDFHSKKVKYHDECKRDYLNKGHVASKPAKRIPMNTAHEKAFQYLSAYIQSSVIGKNRPEYSTLLHRHYCQYLDNLSVEMEAAVTYSTAKTVRDEIIKHFGNNVTLEMMCKKQGLILHSNLVCKEEAFRRAMNCNYSEEFIIVESAYILRSAILNVVNSSPSLPLSLSVNDFKEGQSKPPDILLKFLEILYSVLRIILQKGLKGRLVPLPKTCYSAHLMVQ